MSHEGKEELATYFTKLISNGFTSFRTLRGREREGEGGRGRGRKRERGRERGREREGGGEGGRGGGREGEEGRGREDVRKWKVQGKRKKIKYWAKINNNYKLLIIFEFWTVCAPPQSVAMVSSQRAAPLD